jgi:hypothetical protein
MMDATTLEERLAAIEAELQRLRDELAALTLRVEPAIESAELVRRVINHRVNDQHVKHIQSKRDPIPSPQVTITGTQEERNRPIPPKGDPAPKGRLLCRIFGHNPGPKMGLMVTCRRCDVIYKLGRGT